MPNDISQHREGENRRSDQVRRDASSSNGGRVRDFATLPFQLHEKQQRATEQQANGKGLAPAERKNRRAIDENGQLVERTVNLRNRYDKDHPGLPGGNENEASQYFKETKELAASDWALLKRKLVRVQSAFETSPYPEGVSTQGKKRKNRFDTSNTIRGREASGSNISEDALKGVLDTYISTLEYYVHNGNGNEEVYLTSLRDRAPKIAETKDIFTRSISNSLGDIESYTRHAHNDLEE